MKTAILILLLSIALSSCATQVKIYETPKVSCTWTEVEELIICRGQIE